MASDTAKNRYSYVYQELSLDYKIHEINFWVYPASATYFSTFELIADWNLIAVLTVSYQSFRAALKNPVQTLRYDES